MINTNLNFNGDFKCFTFQFEIAYRDRVIFGFGNSVFKPGSVNPTEVSILNNVFQERPDLYCVEILRKNSFFDVEMAYRK